MSTEELIRQPWDEIEGLRKENASLLEQNAELRHIVGGLREENAQLRQELAAAEERIAAVEQGKKRPSSFIKPNKPKREGAKEPRRKRAKEQNHGRRRAEKVTRHEEHHIERCPKCACKLRNERIAWRREVIDLPPPQAVEVTEHVIFKGYCPRCEQWQYAVPGETGEVVGQRRFGTRLMALIGYLSESLRLPYDAIRSYLKTIHGVEVSEGAIADLRRGLAEKLQPLADDLQAQIRGSAIVHADETGWREDGQNGYVWAFNTPGEQGIRYYVYDRSRGQQVVEGVLGEEFAGVLGSDFYGAYNVYAGRHQRCWVHLLRDLHDLKEEHPDDNAVQSWAQQLRALYDRAQDFVKAEPHNQDQREKLYVVLCNEVERLGLLYARAEHPCRALAKRVLRHQDELFQFVLVAGLAADNNLAERSLRPLVVVRKISGGTRSPQGSRTRMTLASIFATLKARGLNPFTECFALIRANSSA
jgi:FtsZ-binding cell division protein ZapB